MREKLWSWRAESLRAALFGPTLSWRCIFLNMFTTIPLLTNLFQPLEPILVLLKVPSCCHDWTLFLLILQPRRKRKKTNVYNLFTPFKNSEKEKYCRWQCIIVACLVHGRLMRRVKLALLGLLKNAKEKRTVFGNQWTETLASKCANVCQRNAEKKIKVAVGCMFIH